jgi:hypothetical protein
VYLVDGADSLTTAFEPHLAVTDLAIRNIVYPPAGQDPDLEKGVIIASYCWEQDSLPYSAMPEEERMVQVLEGLSKIHPEARATFEHGISKDWAADRYAGGIGPLFARSRCLARPACATRSRGPGSEATRPTSAPRS